MIMLQRSIVIFLLIGPLSYAQSQWSYAQDSASYPIADPAAQKARDNERRHILESELETERQELAKAQASLTASPTQERAAEVHRHLENIKSLQRELDGVAGRQQAPRQPLRVVVKAQRPAASPRNVNGTAAFWNPYNRVPDPEVTADLPTTSWRESP